MAQEVPLIVRLPELVVAEEELINTPRAESVPLAAVPVIMTLPEPVDETLAELVRQTPLESVPVAQEVPLIVRLPEPVVAEEEVINTPRAKSVPLAAVPVIVTLPEPVDETLAEVLR